jgi:hypothetical protein
MCSSDFCAVAEPTGFPQQSPASSKGTCALTLTARRSRTVELGPFSVHEFRPPTKMKFERLTFARKSGELKTARADRVQLKLTISGYIKKFNPGDKNPRCGVPSKLRLGYIKP